MSAKEMDDSKVLSMRIPAELQKKLAVDGKRRGLTVSAYVRTMLFEKYLDAE